MKLKEVDRTVNVAWSPADHHPIYLAGGTAAQQLDATFSTSALLELYSLNLSESSQEMEVVGSLATESRFFKLIWGTTGQLIGGAEQGQIFVWNPEQIVKGSEENVLIHQLKKHTGPVAALDINPFASNLLASGAGESEIFIWDLASPDKPMAPGVKTQPVHDVAAVAWNRQVQHILGSSNGGSCIVWDLRKNEPIIKIRDSMSRIKCHTICWHPDVATQLCISSEDDHSPVIQLWDLRSASSPLKTLENHTRGILSMAWNQADADLLLSCGKDNRIICWNPNSEQRGGEVVYDLTTGVNQWCFDVQWCPRSPAVISACSFDGHVSIYSLLGGGLPSQTSSKVSEAFPSSDPFSQLPLRHQSGGGGGGAGMIDGLGVGATGEREEPVLKRPPKWLRRPVGASFAFGGKLVCFEYAKPSQPGAQTSSPRLVSISQVTTATDLVQRSHALEAALQNSAYVEFCEQKLAQGGGAENKGGGGGGIDSSIWQFLKVNFEDNPRLRYLELLGYSQLEIGRQVMDTLGSGHGGQGGHGSPGRGDRGGVRPASVSPASVSGGSRGGRGADSDVDDGTDDSHRHLASTLDAFGVSLAGDGGMSSAFDSLSVDASAAVSDIGLTSNQEEFFDDSPLEISVGDKDYEGLLSRALLTANFEAAVKVCLHFGHPAEAIILAISGGQELLAKTQREVLAGQGHDNHINKLISAVVTRDLGAVVRRCDVRNWREALATVLTYADGDEFTSLCDVLGGRLEACNDPALSACAQLCYIVAGNVDKIVHAWCQRLPRQTTQLQLQDLVERIMLVRRAVDAVYGERQVDSIEMSEKLTQYASLLAAQGCLDTAYNYLSPTSRHLSVAMLRDRLYHSMSRAPGQSSSAGTAPPRPFNVVNVQPDLQQQQLLQQRQQQQMIQQQVQQSRQRTTSANYNAPITDQTHYPQQYAGGAYVPQSSGGGVGIGGVYMGGVAQPVGLIPQATSYQNASVYPVNVPAASGYQPTVAAPVQPSYIQPQTEPLSAGTGFRGNRPAGRYPSGAGGGVSGGGVGTTAVGGGYQANLGSTQSSQWTGPTQAGAATSTYDPINYQQQQGYMNPAASSTQHVTPGGPYVPGPAKAWNDPPVVSHEHRSKSHTDAPGAPKYEGNIYNPQDYQLQHPQQIHAQQTQHGGLARGVLQQQQAARSSTPQQQEQQQWNEQQQQPMMMMGGSAPPMTMGGEGGGYNEGVISPPTPPLPPIPDEHLVLQQVLDGLAHICINTTTNGQVKKKLEDVLKKLDLLYRGLRMGTLSQSTTNGLHQIVASIQQYDYATSLSCHAEMIRVGSFSEISAFMPAVKILLQTAQQLQAYIQ